MSLWPHFFGPSSSLCYVVQEINVVVVNLMSCLL